MRKLLLAVIVFACAPVSSVGQEKPQILIRPPAQEEIILAVPDVQPKRPDQATELADALQTFNRVLWDDLKFSGFFTLAGKGFYPPKPIVVPEDIEYEAWAVLPFRVSFLASGTLDLTGGILSAELRIFDMKQQSMSFGQRISGDSDQARSIAHRWADEIVYRLTAGASQGIATTKILYTARMGRAKEIYVMDYDGDDARAFTRNGGINLFPTWGDNSSKIAFTSDRTGRWEINLHSYQDGSRLPFPLFSTFASTPMISPDGTKLAFALRTPRGDADIFVSQIDGSNRQNITNHPGIDTSPTWAPSGRQIAFASSRIGYSQIYICDADGANLRRIIKEGGDADAPSWAPDGRFIAFQWRPRLAYSYDIFLAEVSSVTVHQATSNAGSNESPSWAPDSRHLAFESTRNGSTQIFIMLADGTELRQVTDQGINTSPAWSGYLRKN